MHSYHGLFWEHSLEHPVSQNSKIVAGLLLSCTTVIDILCYHLHIYVYIYHIYIYIYIYIYMTRNNKVISGNIYLENITYGLSSIRYVNFTWKNTICMAEKLFNAVFYFHIEVVAYFTVTLDIHDTLYLSFKSRYHNLPIRLHVHVRKVSSQLMKVTQKSYTHANSGIPSGRN